MRQFLYLALTFTLPATAWASTSCADVWANAKAQAREVVAHGLALDDPDALTFAWRVNGEAFVLAAKLRNAEEDLTARRLACRSVSYTRTYVSVPSYPWGPPPGATLARAQATLANAAQQLEARFGDIDAVYLPCGTCMTDTEHAILLLPVQQFIDTTDDAARQVFGGTNGVPVRGVEIRP